MLRCSWVIPIIETVVPMFLIGPAHKESLQRRAPDTHPEGWCLPCDLLHSHARPSERGPKLPNLGHGCLAPHPLRRRPQAAWTVHCTTRCPRSFSSCNLNQEDLEASTQLTPRRVPQASTQPAGGKPCKLLYPDAGFSQLLLALIFQPRHPASAMDTHSSLCPG